MSALHPPLIVMYKLSKLLIILNKYLMIYFFFTLLIFITDSSCISLEAIYLKRNIDNLCCYWRLGMNRAIVHVVNSTRSAFSYG